MSLEQGIVCKNRMHQSDAGHYAQGPLDDPFKATPGIVPGLHWKALCSEMKGANSNPEDRTLTPMTAMANAIVNGALMRWNCFVTWLYAQLFVVRRRGSHRKTKAPTATVL